MFGTQRDFDHLDYEAIKRRAREERARYVAKLFKAWTSVVGQFVRRQLSVLRLPKQKNIRLADHIVHNVSRNRLPERK